MAYFYQANLPLPLNLFHPRWLIDDPPILHEIWQMRVDNPNYDLSDRPREDRYIRDKFANRGEQVILDITIELVELHKQLPPEDAPHFAKTVQRMARNLKSK
jgi:hypothetical protein